MKLLSQNSRKRIIAGICAVIVVFGGVGTVLLAKSRKKPEGGSFEKNISMRNMQTDNGTISAGGTVESQQLCDYLGFTSTSLRLKVEEVYVESGEIIEEGTAIYKLTADSLEKAEKTLNTELQTAESTLLNQKMQYAEDKNAAYALYQSELLLGDTASDSLNSGMTSLDSDLQSAYTSYTDALNTVNHTPTEIASKQAESNAKQNDISQYQSMINSLQSELNQKKNAYTTALQTYNSMISEYNAAAGTVRFLGEALGMDVSGIQLVHAVQAEQETQPDSGEGQPGQNTPDFGGGGGADFPNKGDFSPMAFSVMQNETSMLPSENNEAAQGIEQPTEPDRLTMLYEAALSSYEEKKASLSTAESTYRNAESEYKSVQNSITEYNTAMKEAQNTVSSLTKEISSLNTKLSQAKRNLSSLATKYNSLKSSYDGDKLDLQQTYDSNAVSGSNAEYNYQITLATIEADLKTAQDAYDTAENNLKIFKEMISDGIVEAQQGGMVYSVTYEAGNSMNVNSPLIYFVNEETYTTTVEVDQYDVIKINVGDEVTIYSSETGTETGTITSIVAGETTSLADVNFNVTITAGEGTKLYPGESVNVYFNASGMSMSDFMDAPDRGEGGENGRPDFGGEMPDFGGEMPEGFDPSNMPQGGGRPDFGDRKED